MQHGGFGEKYSAGQEDDLVTIEDLQDVARSALR